uniref:Uncharacterized protein n=1 Tax=Anguilla anguilla TaxID=7936 RepID=A0A0E9XN63_ANGAN
MTANMIHPDLVKKITKSPQKDDKKITVHFPPQFPQALALS